MGAALLVFVWFPHYRPALRDGERYGVDVSHHQGEIDWDRVARDDITFAYIKATEGKDHVDRRFEQNWEGARAVGLQRGAYHFFTLCSPGRAQAQHFVDVVPDDVDALPAAVDLELAGNCAARPPAAEVRAELDAFLDVVEEATGKQAVLYVGDDFERTYPVRKALDRPLWHRRILWRADVEGWWIWQFTGWGRVDGISGRADVNVMRGHR
ncbi:MAG TPA: GH25 family lysozyme [Acidimicrobiales bacterium]|nr:GH25 family lysozyme [Acidimicrobiales bacterium]